MVSALILLNHKGRTYEQLSDRIDFDLKTRLALCLQTLSETPFVESILFDFQDRVNQHMVKTGRNLFEIVYNSLTQGQLKHLKIKADIQRSDSFLAASNIRRYGRVQLLVEVLDRFHRILSDSDRGNCADLVSRYVKKPSHKFVYKLDRKAIPHELEKLG